MVKDLFLLSANFKKFFESNDTKFESGGQFYIKMRYGLLLSFVVLNQIASRT